MTYDAVVEIALMLPDAEAGTMYGSPAVKRAGRYMFSEREPGVLAVKLDWENRDRLLGEYPDLIYIIPHFHGWPAFLVRLKPLRKELAKEIVAWSWADAPRPSKRREAP